MPQIATNFVTELRFASTTEHTDPFNDVSLDAVFTDPDGAQRRVPAFWAGGNVWKVRYASPAAGSHRFRLECSDVSDSGLHRLEGSVEIEPYQGGNPLYRHGPIRNAADGRHFEHADGTPFLWVGDTWWMSLCRRMGWPDDFQALTADRKAKGFNLIQIVAGLYPDQGAFDARGANETGFPWEADYQRIRPEYFDAADRRLTYLVEQGLVPCIVGAWGYHLPWLGPKKMKQHMRYLVARYGAMPVVWCVAGEFNLPYYQTPGFPFNDEKQAADWEPILRYVRSINAFGRLVTVHPTGMPPYSARRLLSDEALIDFDMLQTGHGDGVLPLTISSLRASLTAEPPMPVLNAEVAYEALGEVSPQIPRMACWMSLLSGAAGHTYGANGIWQLNRKGRPYGNSPTGGSYGDLPWDEAMHLPGGKEVALAATLLADLPFQDFEPHLEWAEWVTPSGDDVVVPYAAGIPGVIRVVYAPAAGAVILQGLEPGVHYAARRFDPVSGSTTDLGPVLADPDGRWFAPAAPWDHDWVLTLDAHA